MSYQVMLHYKEPLLRQAVLRFWWRLIGFRFVIALILMGACLPGWSLTETGRGSWASSRRFWRWRLLSSSRRRRLFSSASRLPGRGLARCLCAILGGQASWRAKAPSGSDAASPSRNHRGPSGAYQLSVFLAPHSCSIERSRPGPIADRLHKLTGHRIKATITVDNVMDISVTLNATNDLLIIG